MKKAYPIYIFLVVLTGCAVGPNYKRPEVSLPANFRGATVPAGTNSLADLAFWEVFQDPTLESLVRTALTNNYDLRIAISRVEQARAVLVQNRGLFFPQLNYGAGVSRGRNASGGQAVFEGGATVDSFSFAGNASWELDLWGRIRRLNESARAELLANEEARHGVMVTLVSDVATTYFQILALDNALEIARRTTNSFGESLRIFSQRLQGGIVSKLEASAAEALLASAAATVPELERQIFIAENRLSILLGQNPEGLRRSQTLLSERLPVEVPAGLPGELLQRRPDIRETEALLHSANAQVGVAVADFFPRLSLTGLFGQVSPELSALTSGGANAWSLGSTLAGPLFHGGQLVGRYRQQIALREEAELRYRLAVLVALQDVSNALISREKYAQERVEQARAVVANQTAVQVATERYVAGRAGYYELLLQQQQLFPAENSLVQTELNQWFSLIQLYRALGGGW